MEQFPIEIFHDILINVRLIDIVSLAQTCSKLNSMCLDEKLWKRMVKLESTTTQLVQNRVLFILPKTKPVKIRKTWLKTYKNLTRVIYTVACDLKEDGSFYTHAFNSKQDATKFAWVNYFKDSHIDWDFIFSSSYWSHYVKELDSNFLVRAIRNKTQEELVKLCPTLRGLTSGQFQEVIKEYFKTRTEYKKAVLTYFADDGYCSIHGLTVSIDKTRIF